MKPGWHLFLLNLTFFIFILSPLSAEAGTLPGFPGAEGFGAETPGGRGGRVIKVTNLNPDGPGSLQEACSADGPRTVVFEVSGVIPGPVSIEHGLLTIAGQTAPGAGITVKGRFGTEPGAARLADIIVRFIRVRPDRSFGDEWDTVQFNNVDRCVLDHISACWSVDETFGLYMARDITVQWCTIEESDTEGHPKGRHNYGLLSGPDGWRVSIHHNLFAHHSRRCPAVANGPADVRNNVVYDFRDGFLHDNPTNNIPFNIIGNYYKKGPSSQKIFPFCFADSAFYYLRDNYIEGVGKIQDPWAEKDKLPGLAAYADKGFKADREAEAPEVTTQSPQEAMRLVLASAGCFPRDTITRRTIEEVKSGTGSWGRHDPGDLMSGLTPGMPPEDKDNDGMSDEWELSNGLNPEDGSDCNQVMKSGYTAIEEYCNWLAEKLIKTGSNMQE
ncbi:MAG TPA: pectate lyase precursor [archaeon]|nr:pectate lyase precursor [archaeon]